MATIAIHEIFPLDSEKEEIEGSIQISKKLSTLSSEFSYNFQKKNKKNKKKKVKKEKEVKKVKTKKKTQQ